MRYHEFIKKNNKNYMKLVNDIIYVDFTIVEMRLFLYFCMKPPNFHPSQGEISDDLAVSRVSINKVIAKLIERGFLVKDKKIGSKNQNIYTPIWPYSADHFASKKDVNYKPSFTSKNENKDNSSLQGVLTTVISNFKPGFTGGVNHGLNALYIEGKTKCKTKCKTECKTIPENLHFLGESDFSNSEILPVVKSTEKPKSKKPKPIEYEPTDLEFAEAWIAWLHDRGSHHAKNADKKQYATKLAILRRKHGLAIADLGKIQKLVSEERFWALNLISPASLLTKWKDGLKVDYLKDALDRLFNGDSNINELNFSRDNRTDNKPSVINTNAKTNFKASQADFDLAKRWETIAKERWPYLKVDLAKWAYEISELKAEFNFDNEKIRQLIHFIYEDPFWQNKIQTPVGLRNMSQNGVRKIDNIFAAFREKYCKYDEVMRWAELVDSGQFKGGHFGDLF